MMRKAKKQGGKDKRRDDGIRKRKEHQEKGGHSRKAKGGSNIGT